MAWAVSWPDLISERGNYAACQRRRRSVVVRRSGKYLQRRPGLVPGWVTVRRYTLLIFDHPPRPTQPGHPSMSRRSEYRQWWLASATEYSYLYQVVGPLLLGLLAYWLSRVRSLAVNWAGHPYAVLIAFNPLYLKAWLGDKLPCYGTSVCVKILSSSSS